MLEDFSAHRAEITQITASAARLAAEMGETSIARRLEAEGQKLAAEELNLAVMGEFKRGKSTLVNAIIGAEVLTTAAVPLTSVLTAVRRGPEPRAQVRFLDGQTEEVGLAELADYTTERGNPGNEKGVAEVEIEYPADLLRPGVRLVDTPGVGSVYEANTAVTLDFLPRVDAALFVLGADQPASRGELEFLGRIRAHVEKLFFVLNKIDLLAAGEREEAVAFCHRQLEQAVGDERVRLYPLSARLALRARLRGQALEVRESGLSALEADLDAFLATHRARVLLAGARRRTVACLEELAGRVELRRQAAAMPLATLEERMREFDRQGERILWSRAAIGGLLAEAGRELVGALEATHTDFIAARAPLVVAALEQQCATQWRGRRQLISALQRTLERAIGAAVRDWAGDQARRVSCEVAALLERVRSHANGIIDEVRNLVRDLFGTEVAPNIELSPFSLDPPAAHVDAAFSLMIEELPLLLPRPLARRLVRRRFIAAVPGELQRNLTIATAEFRRRLTEAERAFEYDFRARVEEMLASLSAVLARAREDRVREEAESAAAAAQLEQHAGAIAELRARLDGLGVLAA